MNVDFSGTSGGGTEKNDLCFPNSPPWTPSFLRVSVRSWTNFLSPACQACVLAAPLQRPRPGPAFGFVALREVQPLFWGTGNLSPRNLEFSSSFRAILESFGGFARCGKSDLPPKGNPLGPEK